MHFFKHLGIVLKHKHFVFIYACKMGIPWTGFIHDLSKFSPTEFLRSARYYQGDKSPTIEERNYNDGFSYICVHHTGRNKHHWHYWMDYNDNSFVINRIPYKNSIEYVCDVLSASRAYMKKDFTYEKAYQYFINNMGNYIMHPQSKEFISWALKTINEEGFRAVKKKITKEKYQEIASKYPNVVFIKAKGVLDFSVLDIKE